MKAKSIVLKAAFLTILAFTLYLLSSCSREVERQRIRSRKYEARVIVTYFPTTSDYAQVNVKTNKLWSTRTVAGFYGWDQLNTKFLYDNLLEVVAPSFTIGDSIWHISLITDLDCKSCEKFYLDHWGKRLLRDDTNFVARTLRSGKIVRLYRSKDKPDRWFLLAPYSRNDHTAYDVIVFVGFDDVAFRSESDDGLYVDAYGIGNLEKYSLRLLPPFDRRHAEKLEFWSLDIDTTDAWHLQPAELL